MRSLINFRPIDCIGLTVCDSNVRIYNKVGPHFKVMLPNWNFLIMNVIIDSIDSVIDRKYMLTYLIIL